MVTFGFMHLSLVTCVYQRLKRQTCCYLSVSNLIAGEENAKVSEEEVNVVRMKTRLMKRAEISQSMVTTQQGTFKECTLTA